MQIVYAVGTASVAMPDGAVHMVHVGTHWPADDPVVLLQPTLFSRNPRFGLNYTVEPVISRDVEQTTAAPGEKRPTPQSVRRA